MFNSLKWSRINIFIGLYALFLLLYFFIFNTKLHTSGDLFENYVWGQTWSWGNDKHPPLVSWIAHIWFTILPTSIATYFYLVTLNMVISLSFLSKAMEYFFDQEQILVAIILTALVTTFGIKSGYKYNCNLAQLPFITGFFWLFAKAIHSNQLKHYAYAGLFCGLGLLTKYTFIFIVTPYALVLLFTQRKNLNFAGLVFTSLVTLALFLPHLIWEIHHAWPSLNYASTKIATNKTGFVLKNFINVMDIFSFMRFSIAGLVISYLQVIRNKSIKLEAHVSPDTPVKLGALTLLISLLLILIIANFKQIKIDRSWLIANCILTGWALVDLMPRRLNFALISKRLTNNYVIYIIITLVFAFYTSKSTPLPESNMILRLSDDVTEYFEFSLKTSLDYVGGNPDFAYGVSFYSKLHPKGFTGVSGQAVPWIDSADLKKSNFVIICRTLSKYSCQQKTSEEWGKPDEIKYYEYSYIDKDSHKEITNQFAVWIYLRRKE